MSFEKSEEVGELFAALAKAQGEMGSAEQNAKGNWGNYSNVQEVWRTWQKVGPKHGLALLALPTAASSGRLMMSLRVILGHRSGQYIAGEYPLNPTKLDPQGIGSAITFARRYGIQAITGQVSGEEDDDGTRASEGIELYSEDGDMLRAFDPKGYAIEFQKRMDGIASKSGDPDRIRRTLKNLWLANVSSRGHLPEDTQGRLRDRYNATLAKISVKKELK